VATRTRTARYCLTRNYTPDDVNYDMRHEINLNCISCCYNFYLLPPLVLFSLLFIFACLLLNFSSLFTIFISVLLFLFLPFLRSFFHTLYRYLHIHTLLICVYNNLPILLSVFFLLFFGTFFPLFYYYDCFNS
jgi:hypothetical protein